MIALAYFQTAADLFEPVAGLNDPGVMASFRAALGRVRRHMVDARAAAQPGAPGGHEDVCYHFHASTALLMAVFDGLAVYVEKKVAPTPTAAAVVYWASSTTFVDPLFSKLRAVQQRTESYIIKGGITIDQ